MGLIHSSKYVTNVDAKCVQPNAVDVRIQTLNELIPVQDPNSANPIVIGEHRKSFHKVVEDPVHTNEHHILGEGYWILYPGRQYDVITKHSVKIPEGMAGWLIIRSTLSRNGLILSGGLYDSGYDGRIGFTLTNLSGSQIYLEKDCRVAQFIMAQADSSHLYDGYYNKNEGLSK